MNEELLSRIDLLLGKYINDHGSDKERLELADLLTRYGNEEKVKDLILRELEELGEDHDKISHFLPENRAADILQQVIDIPVAPMYDMRKRHRRRRYMIAAASMIGLTLLAGWLFRPQETKPSVIAAKQMTHEILPGHEGAVLKLAGGDEVILDTAANGVLARQGNTTVMKKDGKISYGAGNTATAAIYNTMITPRGRQYMLELSDGTKVWLNAASTITYPASFGKDERKVSITGEAYFEVAHNSAWPFKVEAAGTTIEVLGTHFNVNSYGDEESQQTTLLEGSVRLQQGGKPGTPILLLPGQQAQVNNATGKTNIAQANTEQVISWKNGYFDFKNANVRTIMRQLARWYDIEIEYKEHVTNEEFGGKMQRNLNLSAIMDIIQTIGIKYHMNGRTMTIGD